MSGKRNNLKLAADACAETSVEPCYNCKAYIGDGKYRCQARCARPGRRVHKKNTKGNDGVKHHANKTEENVQCMRNSSSMIKIGSDWPMYVCASHKAMGDKVEKYLSYDNNSDDSDSSEVDAEFFSASSRKPVNQPIKVKKKTVKQPIKAKKTLRLVKRRPIPRKKPTGVDVEKAWEDHDRNNRYEGAEELVDVKTLWALREYDRNKKERVVSHKDKSSNIILSLKKELVRDGQDMPVFITVYKDEARGNYTAYLSEGNHRIAAARKANIRALYAVGIESADSSGPDGVAGVELVHGPPNHNTFFKPSAVGL